MSQEKGTNWIEERVETEWGVKVFNLRPRDYLDADFITAQRIADTFGQMRAYADMISIDVGAPLFGVGKVPKPIRDAMEGLGAPYRVGFNPRSSHVWLYWLINRDAKPEDPR